MLKMLFSPDDAGGGAPAPVTPAVIPTPAGGPALSAVEQASVAARTAIAEGRPIDGSAPPKAPASDVVREVGANIDVSDDDDIARLAAARAAQGAGDGGDADDDADGAGDGTEGTEGEEKPEGTEGEGEEGADGEGGGDDPLVVKLPGRQIGEEIEIAVDTPEVAERLQQLAKGYMRGNEVREAEQQIVEGFSQLTDVMEQLEADPVGFVLENMNNDAIVDHLVLNLLTQPAVFARLREKVLTLDDPDALRMEQADQRLRRYEMRDEIAKTREDRRVSQENFTEVMSTISALLPADMPEARQRQFVVDAKRDIKDYVDRHKLHTIPASEVPLLLAQRLRTYGVDPYQAAARATQRETPAARPNGKIPVPPKKGAPGAPAARTGKEFVARANARRAAASVPAGGAGAPTMTSDITPPLGKDGQAMGIEETVKWHKARLAKKGGGAAGKTS